MGMLSSGTLEYLSDFTGSQGGPIKRDRLWFFGSYHQFNTGDVVPGTLFDDGAQGTDKQHIRQPMVRLTYQLTPSNKVSGYVEITDKQRSHDMVSQVDPETAASRWTSPNYSTGNVKFTSTMSSRLLFEGGYSMNREYRDRAGAGRDLQGSRHAGMVRVGEPDAADRRQRAVDGADDLVHA